MEATLERIHVIHLPSIWLSRCLPMTSREKCNNALVLVELKYKLTETGILRFHEGGN